MISRYKEALAEARATCGRLQAPKILVPTGVCVVALTIAIALGVVFGSPTHASSQFQEEGGITKFSALLMAVASLLALATFVFSRSRPRRGAWFWILAALAFAYFAFDEVVQVHEQAGLFMQHENASPGIFRNWNDIVVILYGVGAIFVCGAFLPEILRLPRFGLMIAVAGFFYVAHTAIDSVFTRSDLSVMVEESSKLFSTGFFAIAFLTSAIGIRRLHELPSAPTPDGESP